MSQGVDDGQSSSGVHGVVSTEGRDPDLHLSPLESQCDVQAAPVLAHRGDPDVRCIRDAVGQEVIRTETPAPRQDTRVIGADDRAPRRGELLEELSLRVGDAVHALEELEVRRRGGGSERAMARSSALWKATASGQRLRGSNSASLRSTGRTGSGTLALHRSRSLKFSLGST